MRFPSGSLAAATFTLTLAAAALPSQGTTPFRAASPAECSKALTEWRKNQTTEAYAEYVKATPETKAAAQARYNAAVEAAGKGMTERAVQCAAGFDPLTVNPAQLNDLVALYRTAGDTAGVTRATSHFLSLSNLTSRLRGQALTLAMTNEMDKASNYFGILDGAERYVTLIDQLPDSLADLKLAAHSTMLGRYGYLDVADGLDQHARAVIRLARQLGRKSTVISGYSQLARSYADRLHPDSALQLLVEAEREIADTAATNAAFKEFRHRYALIGQPAETIEGEWWINTATPPTLPVRGQVTLIEFTAHWCGPCKNSYPGLRDLAQRLDGTTFRGVMVTQLYGYLGDRKNLTPEQEVEADREYFGKEHALPFPVAINSTPKTPRPGDAYRMPKADSDYRVGGIPQIVIVDKQGIIRQIVTGWDHGNTERFARLIGELLQEK